MRVLANRYSLKMLRVIAQTQEKVKRSERFCLDSKLEGTGMSKVDP